jgi:biotin operon repressor
MAQILQSKNLATRFQIMVEIAANQPTVHQKSIAAKLNVTPQAISEYMMKLEQDGWVASDGRSKYRGRQWYGGNVSCKRLMPGNHGWPYPIAWHGCCAGCETNLSLLSE